MSKKTEELRLPSYGGQALIEGVLMRSSTTIAAAMRAPDGTIQTHVESLGGIYKSWIKSTPFLRGLLLLWDGLGLGIRFLTISANVQAPEEEKLDKGSMAGSVALSFLIAIVFFFLLPAGIGQLGERFLGFNGWVSNLIEGLIRLALLVGYIWAVGRIPEIGRVFAYHGAEHKTINAFEAGAEMTPEKVIQYSVEHPRCGTAFLLTLVLFSIILFSALGPLPIFWRFATRILFIPVLAGVAYEFIRFSSDHMDNPIMRWLIKPNLALQHLTTREPDLAIVEVAITAFTTMLAEDEKLKNASSSPS